MVFANTVTASMDHRKHRNMQNVIEHIGSRSLLYDAVNGINCEKLAAPLTPIASQAAKGSSKVAMNVDDKKQFILPF